MAEIVQSLFGVSPEMYQRQQQDRADAQALRFAQLDPFQQANFAIGRGANMLGGAIGGALGGQDPELQRITMRQQIASQIDFTDPASIQQGMNALGDDVMGKQQLAQIYRQQQESGALIGQRTAAATRERAPTGDVAKAMRVNEITRALQTPEISDLERIGLEAELNSLSPAKPGEKPLEKERLADLVARRAGPPGTPEYIAAFNSSIDKQMEKQPGVVVQTGDKRDQNIFEKVDVPRLQQFTDAASSARALARDAEVIQRLLAGSGGGSLIKLTTDIQRSLGFETDRVNANDLANALATRGAVQIRAPGSGATSDLEFKAYVQAFPSLANSEGGRKLMSKYATAFSKRSAKLADHTRKLIRDGNFSEQAIAEYDDSLGPVLDDEFYKFSPGRRPNVPVYTPRAAPSAAPAARTPAPPARSVDDVLNQYLPNN
jgi:hypothetical protein